MIQFFRANILSIFFSFYGLAHADNYPQELKAQVTDGNTVFVEAINVSITITSDIVESDQYLPVTGTIDLVSKNNKVLYQIKSGMITKPPTAPIMMLYAISDEVPYPGSKPKKITIDISMSNKEKVGKITIDVVSANRTTTYNGIAQW